MITLNEKEVQAILEKLSELKIKEVIDIYLFLINKVKESKENKDDSTELSE